MWKQGAGGRKQKLLLSFIIKGNAQWGLIRIYNNWLQWDKYYKSRITRPTVTFCTWSKKVINGKLLLCSLIGNTVVLVDYFSKRKIQDFFL